MKRPYIIYSLPKSRTTQAFISPKIDKAFEDIRHFFQKCTTANINCPDTLQLTAYTSYDSSDPWELLEAIINKTTQRFGQSEVSPIAYHYPSGEPHTTNKYEWNLPSERLDEAIRYIIENSPMPKSNFGPLDLYISYNFKLLDINTKHELPNQQHLSDISIWFSRGKSCSPDLFFPFEQADEEFWNYVDGLIRFLPFKLEERYLKLARVNKEGKVSSFKKNSAAFSDREQLPLTLHLCHWGTTLTRPSALAILSTSVPADVFQLGF